MCMLLGGSVCATTATRAPQPEPGVVSLQINGPSRPAVSTSSSIWPAGPAPALPRGLMNGGPTCKPASADKCPSPKQPRKSVKRSSVQRCSAAPSNAASADASARFSDDGAADGDGAGGKHRAAARLTQWKAAAMADCTATEKLQFGAKTLQVLLALQPVNLTSRERIGGMTRSASGASRRIGSLTNGLP